MPGAKRSPRGERAEHPLNALRHGVFAEGMVVLPWEDRREFVQLHNDLIEEWNPDGETELDVVFTIAKCIWRKRRMQYFLHAKVEGYRIDPDHSAYDEAFVLRQLLKSVEVAPDEFEVVLHALRANIANDLRQKFPQESFESTSEWVQAVQNEIRSNLLPAIERFGEPPPEVKIFQSAAAMSQEVIENELAVEERIDAMINGAIKRLVQTKAMKQMLNSASLKGRRERTARGESMPKAGRRN
jgi:hypothetical protein